MAVDIVNIVNKIFDSSANESLRRNALVEFKRAVEQDGLDNLSVNDIKAALSDITIATTPNSSQKDFYNEFMYIVMAQKPTPEKINDLKLPIIASQSRNLDFMKEFAKNKEVDFITPVFIDRTKLRGASAISIAASNNDPESQQIFELLVERELAEIESDKVIDIGDWISSIISDIDSIKLASNRFAKYKDKIKLNPEYISQVVITIDSLMSAVENLDELKVMTDLQEDLTMHSNMLDSNSVAVLMHARASMDIENLKKELPEVKVKKNKLAFKAIVLSGGEQSNFMKSTDNYIVDDESVELMESFSKKVSKLEDKQKEELRYRVFARKLSDDSNIVYIVSNKDRLQEFARSLGKSPNLQIEYDAMMENNPEFLPFKKLIDESVDRIHKQRSMVRRAAIYMVPSYISDDKKIEDFLSPYSNEASKQSINTINDLLELIKDDEFIAPQKKSELIYIMDKQKSNIIDASAVSEAFLDLTLELALASIADVNTKIMDYNIEFKVGKKIEEIKHFIDVINEKYGIEISPSIEAKLSKLDDINGMKKIDSLIEDIYSEYIHDLANKYFDNQVEVIVSLEISDDKKKEALDALNAKKESLLKNANEKGPEYVLELKDKDLNSKAVSELVKKSIVSVKIAEI